MVHLEGGQNFFGVVDEVENVGRIFSGIRPIQPGQRLYGLDSGEPFIDINPAEKRLVEAGLEFIGDQQNSILIALNASRMSRPRKSGFSSLLFSVNGSGPESASFTSPENATKVRIG